MYPLRSVILTYRQKWQLPLYQNLNDYYSPLAQISQEPAEFEFPRRNLPAYFHFVGPYHSATPREPIAFPYDRLTGQPLVYASLGTIMGRLSYIFESIAQACQTLKVQLVISLGGSIETDTLFSLPGNPIVVAYAPQLELLKRANLTITHAGLNTTLESLTDGVPMIAIPVANDGPGVATRIRWTGTGKVLNPSFLTVQDLRHAIQTVLSEPSYRQNALGLKAAIVRSGGLIQAVKIIESAIKT
jgi:MGT family glycosyltransferase